jgi:hypothetical protein
VPQTGVHPRYTSDVTSHHNNGHSPAQPTSLPMKSGQETGLQVRGSSSYVKQEGLPAFTQAPRHPPCFGSKQAVFVAGTSCRASINTAYLTNTTRTPTLHHNNLSHHSTSDLQRPTARPYSQAQSNQHVFHHQRSQRPLHVAGRARMVLLHHSRRTRPEDGPVYPQLRPGDDRPRC